jgi:hypothetical protein
MPATPSSLARVALHAQDPPFLPSNLAKASLQQTLNKPAQDKISKYTNLLRGIPLCPIVISLGGGSIEDSTVKVLEAFREVIGYASYSYFLRRIIYISGT